MKTIASALVVLFGATCATAGPIAVGFSVEVLGPTLPGGATTSTVTAIAPDGSLWMSNGATLFQFDGLGNIVSQEHLQGVVFPANSATTDLAFDSSGRAYINDFFNNKILRKESNGSWSHFASVLWPRQMSFDSQDNLIVLGGNGNGAAEGKAWLISPAGVATEIGDIEQGESFAFAPNGDLLIPRYDGTGIDRLTRSGQLTNIFTYERPVPILFESIELTDDGNFIVGVNTGYDFQLGRNTSRVIRIDGTTGRQELIGIDIADAIPVDMLFAESGRLAISGFGSLKPLGLSGDFDGALNIAAVPEPAAVVAWVIMGIAAVAFGWYRCVGQDLGAWSE